MAEERSVGREYLEALIIAAVFLLFTNTFVVQTFYIPSGSMEDTLLIGDHLFVNRFIYGPTATGAERLLPFRTVHRGDIVVFRSPEDPKLDLVKRCMAVGGDTVQMTHKQLYINGKLDGSIAIAAIAKQTADPVYIGRRADGLFTNAVLDEIAIYPTALSSERIATHWQAASNAP